MASNQDWEKRARELYCSQWSVSTIEPYMVSVPMVDAMLKLGVEMADARAEEIAQEIEISSKEHEAMRMEHHDWWARGLREAQALARSTIKKPKAREQVLEEALKQMERALAYATCGMNRETIVCLLPVARKALEWKGDA